MSFRPCQQNAVPHPTVPLSFSSGSYRYAIDRLAQDTEGKPGLNLYTPYPRRSEISGSE